LIFNHETHELHENKTAHSSFLNFVCFVYFVVDQIPAAPLTPALSPPRGEGEEATAASKFLGRGERQAAFAVEKFFQALVAGTGLAPDDFRRNKIAQFAAMTPAFQPVFVAD
jgi:hypothetical protein